MLAIRPIGAFKQRPRTAVGVDRRQMDRSPCLRRQVKVVSSQRNDGLEAIEAEYRHAKAVMHVELGGLAHDPRTNRPSAAVGPDLMPSERLHIDRALKCYQILIDLMIINVAVEPPLRPCIDYSLVFELPVRIRQSGDHEKFKAE